jgi:hypothetical protein
LTRSGLWGIMAMVRVWRLALEDAAVLPTVISVPSLICHFMDKEVVPMDESRSSSTLAHLRGAS